MTSITHSTAPRYLKGTLAAMQSPNFRLYFAGQLVSLSGTWMQTVAQGWLVFHLTQSELWLGLIACAAGLPSLLLSPIAGVLLDRLPRRTLLMATQSSQMLLAFILAALTFADAIQVWHVFLLAIGTGIINALDAPARQTIVVELVGRERLSSGIALNSIMFNSARAIGPAAAGIALTLFGPAWCFLLNGVSFLAVLASLSLLRLAGESLPPEGAKPLAQLREGLAYARQHALIRPLLTLAVIGALFSANVSTLLPAFADRVLHSPTQAYAAMMTAVGLGAVGAGVLMLPLGQRFGRGRVLVMMLSLLMIAELLLALSTTIPMAVGIALIYGFAVILPFVLINIMLQNEVAPQYRGRVVSLYTVSWFGIMPFGALVAGLSAEIIGTPTVIAICGLLGGILSLALLWRSPQVRHLE